MKDISVIVVSWNARACLQECLASIRRTADGRLRDLIVVDNASDDGSAEMVEKEFPDAVLIRAGSNLGFSRANNLGLAYASGDKIALINSDVVVQPGCLAALAACLDENPDVGMAGPQVRGTDGSVKGTCRRVPSVWNTACRALALDIAFPSWPLLSGHEMRHFKHDRSVDADVLSGCFWLVRRRAVDAVGPLDPRFFFYMEDVDWCQRLRSQGWRLRFVAHASAIHHGGASSSNAPLHYSVQYHRASLDYWEKYHGTAGRWTYRLLAVLHHGLRLVLRAVRRVLKGGGSMQSRYKLREDAVCLRWLTTGKGP